MEIYAKFFEILIGTLKHICAPHVLRAKVEQNIFFAARRWGKQQQQQRLLRRWVQVKWRDIRQSIMKRNAELQQFFETIFAQDQFSNTVYKYALCVYHFINCHFLTKLISKIALQFSLLVYFFFFFIQPNERSSDKYVSFLLAVYHNCHAYAQNNVVAFLTTR